MLDISNNIFYFLTTIAQVCATILGFIIVGQIYIYGVMQKAHEKNKEPVKTGEKLCVKVVVEPQEEKSIYILLIVIIFLSILGILFNLETFGKGIIIIPLIVLILFVSELYLLFNYIMNLKNYVPRIYERKRKQ